MESNVAARERTPRIAIAITSAVGGAFAPNRLLKTLLFGAAAAMLTTVATGYCPINAALDHPGDDAPRWRTLKTFRVEA